ncbi:hypothetical protein SI65_03688 [Aspergillus cristatus]|uniref:DNA polymerase n=1 Tax=Aspergillus cristatus TaxID=573508 RepID=A0A1E3BI48_ASPCR|nr:hypothetical protein SI65_03688 [Aspergillus cristatus]
MSDSTLSHSPSQDGPLTQAPTFTSFPPMFVLPTHLTLDELHRVEDVLGNRGARLTYDICEARLVIGKVGQKKRAALELRARGVWTEEVVSEEGEMEGDGGPPVKRRRVSLREEKVDGQAVEQLQDGDVSTESEGEEDGVESQHNPGKHLRNRSVSAASTSTAGSEQTNVIRVVKLQWLEKSMEAQELLPIEPYIVYQARIIDPPTTAKPTTTASDIMQRAQQDALFKPPATPASHFHTRRQNPPQPDGPSQAHPIPKLYRQTTSEHDEIIPLPPVPDWVKNRVMYACMRSASLHPPNERFINQLVKIRKARELTLDEIGVRAYSTSIAAIAAYPYQVRRPSQILQLPGCDAKIANLFAEFQASDTGTCQSADLLETDPDLKTLSLFNNIWGVGAKTARDFYYTRQWRDLDDIVEYGWSTLSRVQQIGVKYYDEFLEGVPRSETEHIASTIQRHANLVRPDADYDGRGVECIIVGGYRRGKAVSGDVDIVLSHRDESVTKNLVVDLVSSLESEGWITHTLALHMTTSNRDQQTLPYRGDDNFPGRHFDTLDKALVVWQDPHFSGPDLNTQSEAAHKKKRNPNIHRRVDIIISPWRTVGCAVLGWSGDTTFERDLRRYAKKAHGWKFDSSGVRLRTSGGHVLDLERGGRTWEEKERLVMEGLGVGYRGADERCSR